MNLRSTGCFRPPEPSGPTEPNDPPEPNGPTEPNDPGAVSAAGYCLLVVPHIKTF